MSPGKTLNVAGISRRDSSISANMPLRFTDSEVQVAFQWLSRDGKRITRDDLRARFECFFPHLSVKDYKLLLGGRDDSVTMKELKDLLCGKILLPGVTPIEDAFQLFDRTERNTIQPAALKTVLQKLDDKSHYHKTDYQRVVQAVDTDHDGEIGLDDFRTMFRSLQANQQANTATSTRKL